MLYNQRVEFVLQQLQLQSTVKVSDLSRQLQVSVDTVRRDLKAMEQQGLIRCVRGGACMPESRVSMSDFTGREIIHSDLKREAARKALAYIHEGDVVALNSGTTNTVLAQELLSLGKKFTVVTNNFAAASVLLQAPQIRLVLVGGQLDPQERSTYGALCEQELPSSTRIWRCFRSTRSTTGTATPSSAWMRSASSSCSPRAPGRCWR